MSEKNGAVSSSGMHASPAVGAKCVKSSGSSFSTRTEQMYHYETLTFNKSLAKRSEKTNLPKIMKQNYISTTTRKKAIEGKFYVDDH